MVLLFRHRGEGPKVVRRWPGANTKLCNKIYGEVRMEVKVSLLLDTYKLNCRWKNLERLLSDTIAVFCGCAPLELLEIPIERSFGCKNRY